MRQVPVISAVRVAVSVYWRTGGTVESLAPRFTGLATLRAALPAVRDKTDNGVGPILRSVSLVRQAGSTGWKARPIEFRPVALILRFLGVARRGGDELDRPHACGRMADSPLSVPVASER